MEYIVSLFPTRVHAMRAAGALRSAGIGDRDFEVKTHEEYTHTAKGWLEQLFGMPEPLSGMEAEGVPHEDGRWLEAQIKAGAALVVVRAGDHISGLVGILERAGATHVRSYAQHGEPKAKLAGTKE